MATEGPSAFLAARGARERALPVVRLLLLLLLELITAAGLAAAAPVEERGEASIFVDWPERAKKADRRHDKRADSSCAALPFYESRSTKR